jgi:hypothetical protein
MPRFCVPLGLSSIVLSISLAVWSHDITSAFDRGCVKKPYTFVVKLIHLAEYSVTSFGPALSGVSNGPN